MAALQIGDRLTWSTFNGTASGVVEQGPEGLLVRLPSGHCFREQDIDTNSTIIEHYGETTSLA